MKVVKVSQQVPLEGWISEAIMDVEQTTRAPSRQTVSWASDSGGWDGSLRPEAEIFRSLRHLATGVRSLNNVKFSRVTYFTSANLCQIISRVTRNRYSNMHLLTWYDHTRGNDSELCSTVPIHRFAVVVCNGQSTVVLWRHPNKYYDVILVDCSRNVSKESDIGYGIPPVVPT